MIYVFFSILHYYIVAIYLFQQCTYCLLLLIIAYFWVLYQVVLFIQLENTKHLLVGNYYLYNINLPTELLFAGSFYS
jgi:hypothetical protein